MKFHFRFNKHERSGIFFLLLIIVVLQGVYFYVKTSHFESRSQFALNTFEQSRLDSIKEQELKKESFKIFPFNPNYISDFRGYTLGMSPAELDRLFAFRKQGNYVNSKEEFQKVTQISDSLLLIMAPYFTFPEWTQKHKNGTAKKHVVRIRENSVTIKDLNSVTAAELNAIRGIGDKLSARIVKFRDRLGGFLVDEQLNDVYGLKPEVVQRTLKKFKVLHPPKVEKININSATAYEISRLIYINRKVAEEIVTLRDERGKIQSFEELFNIIGFPINKIDRIKLYLSL